MENNNGQKNPNGNPEQKLSIWQRFIAKKHAFYARHPKVHKAVQAGKFAGGVGGGIVIGWKLRDRYTAKVTESGEVDEVPTETSETEAE